MKLFTSWKFIAALCIFGAAMAYNSYRKSILEHFGTWEDNIAFMVLYQRIVNYYKHKKAYDAWISWLYAYPGSSGIALDDIKSRLFEPSCKFRHNWYTAPPAGKTIPILLTDRTGVNNEYKVYLDGLKEQNDFDFSIKSLDDIKDRFMDQNCKAKPLSKTTDYSQNFREVFS
jgi:hypothetical protein